MRILYGVAGEGMGHATRSHAFLADLVGEHDVLVVASGRAHDYLAQHFPQVREILGLLARLRGQRHPALGDGRPEPARRGERLADAGAQLLRGGARLRGRRGRQRLRGVRAHGGAPRARAGDQRRQHHDARPLPPRRGHRRRRHARLRAGAADRAHQGAGPALGDRADLLPPAAAAHGDDAGRAGAAGRRCSPPRRSRASTSSSTRRRPAARPWSGRCTRPGCPAGSTACAATSTRTSWTASWSTGRSARPSSSTTCARRAASSPAAVLAALRVRVPAQAGALDPRRRPVRADAQRAVPRAARLRRVRARRRRRRPSARSSSACPSTSARSQATRRTATTRRSPRCASSSRSSRSSAPARARARRRSPAADRVRRLSVRRVTLAVAAPLLGVLAARHGARRDRDRGPVRLGREAADAVPASAARWRALFGLVLGGKPLTGYNLLMFAATLRRLPPAVRVRRPVDGGERARAARRLDRLERALGLPLVPAEPGLRLAPLPAGQRRGGTAAGSGACRSTTRSPPRRRSRWRSSRSSSCGASRRGPPARRGRAARGAGAAARRLRRLGGARRPARAAVRPALRAHARAGFDERGRVPITPPPGETPPPRKAARRTEV